MVTEAASVNEAEDGRVSRSREMTTSDETGWRLSDEGGPALAGSEG